MTNRVIRPTKCDTCQAPITPKSLGRPQRYCNDKCKPSYRREHSSECEHCGETFTHVNTVARFCSKCVYVARVMPLAGKSRTVRDSALHCGGCESWLPDENFHRNKSEQLRRGRATYCIECRNVYDRNYRLRNPQPSIRKPNRHAGRAVLKVGGMGELRRGKRRGKRVIRVPSKPVRPYRKPHASKPGPEYKCEECSKEFTSKEQPNGKFPRFCSRGCYHKHQATASLVGCVCDPEFHRRIRSRYGLTEHDYYRMLIGQQCGCAICDSIDPRNNHNRFFVDHCHESGRIRGLLCSPCNFGLGQVDDPQWLSAAFEYLERPAMTNLRPVASLQGYWKSDDIRSVKLASRYGMTEAMYGGLLDGQGGRCAICRTHDPKDRTDKFHVDHCHEGGQVRGLLCARCNHRLGRVDDVEWFQSAMRFLTASGDDRFTQWFEEG